MRIAILGTGLMGRPMAANLLKAGFDLTVWNRTRDKAAALADAGARVAETPAAAVADRDVVITMLLNGSVVEDVLMQPAVLEALRPRSLVIDMSSIPPQMARGHAGRLQRQGDIDYVDAPVSGGTRGASEASLAIMAGGSEPAFGRARPILQALGSPTHVGPAGSGQLAKCANQVIVAVTIGAVAEGLLLAAHGGADPQAVRDALLGGFADSRILREHGARMLERDFVAGGPVYNQIKDLDTALAAAEGLTLPLSEQVTELFRKLRDEGGEGYDHSALLLALERLNAPARLGDGPDRLG